MRTKMPVSVADLLAKLKQSKKSRDGWTAQCPAHDDNNASLSIGSGDDGRILLHCHAGCSFGSITAALGIKPADLFDSVPKQNRVKRIVAEYNYHDENGKALFQSVRYLPKTFRQRHRSKSGAWVWNMDGVRRVLYRLPDVLAAVKVGQTVYVAEGEKDCDNLAGRGFVATCNIGGAGKWLPDYTDCLRGAKRVVVIADKDAPGRKHADDVAASLVGKVDFVGIVELPDGNGKTVKDATDFFGAGGTVEQFREIVDNAAAYTIQENTPESEALAEPITPAKWFAQKFPSLPAVFGDAVWEETDKHGVVSVRDVAEDFLAATLGDKGSPDAPTVFLPTEERFFTYLPSDGIFIHQRDPALLARLSSLLLECARQCREACDTKALEFRFRDAANLSGVLRKARGQLAVPHTFFSRDLTEFIPCVNGMLRLSDKTLLPYSPSYRRRNKLAVRFDSTATCPLFLETLMCAALDEDGVDLLQRWCGGTLTGENLAQKIMILTGTAGGGKGTFIRVLSGILGEANLASLRPQLLGERFEVGRFLGKTLLYGADVSDDFLNQRGASVLKSLTGYDPMTLEFKNSNESPLITCKFNVIVTCNSRLTVHLEGDCAAWRRRLAIIEYQKPKPDQVIADLAKQILQTEASGVLNWMLAGLDKVRAHGWQLRLTDRQQGAVDNLLLESDGHTLFVREELFHLDGHQLTVEDCFTAYVEFCDKREWTPLPRKKFSQMIGDAVAREHRVTASHDIKDASGKPQRGWRRLQLRQKLVQPTGKQASEVSGSELSDASDTLLTVPFTKISDQTMASNHFGTSDGPITSGTIGKKEVEANSQGDLVL
jgi:putative DNA primase/helicase